MKTMIYLSLLLICLHFHGYHCTGPCDVQGCKTGVDVWHQIIPDNADFAFRLYKEMSSKLDDNILLCPMCISASFAMLSLGAKSETQSQIYKVLGFNLSETEERAIHIGFFQLIHRLNIIRFNMRVKIGNALFLEDSLDVLPTFLEDVKNLYHAEQFSSDFLNCTGAKQQINEYINNKTYGRIVSGAKDLNEHTRLVLMNYIFFKGAWIDHFNPRSTTERDFLAYGNTTVKLNMMHKRATYRFLRDKDLCCSVVEIPFSEGSLGWFILPDKGKLKYVERSLVKEDLEKWRTSFKYREIELWIPKFSISTSYDVKDFLQKLGMTDVFNQHADLSGITAKHNLWVSQALHEAVLVVHEDSFMISGTSHPGIRPFKIPPRRPPPRIKFNRPFLMVLIDSPTGTILLTAKIVNPTKE